MRNIYVSRWYIKKIEVDLPNIGACTIPVPDSRSDIVKTNPLPSTSSDKTSYCKVSQPQTLYLELSDRSEIRQAPRQHRCRKACKISKRCDNLNHQSGGFETSDITIRRLIGYWNGALGDMKIIIEDINWYHLTNLALFIPASRCQMCSLPPEGKFCVVFTMKSSTDWK